MRSVDTQWSQFSERKWDGRKPSMDLRSLVKVRGEFSLMCLVHNVKKIVKKALEGTVNLPGKYSKLIECQLLHGLPSGSNNLDNSRCVCLLFETT
jgi:hypothetical protein